MHFRCRGWRAVVVIPLLGYRILSEHPTRRAFGFHRDATAADHETHADPVAHADVYDTRFYRRLRGWIGWCIDRRWRVLGVTIAAFLAGMAAFGLVPQQFFPSSDRPELLIDLRLPEGASFAATLRETQRLEAALAKRPRDRPSHRLRRRRSAAVLSAPGSATRRAEFRPVRRHRQERERPRDPGNHVGRGLEAPIPGGAHAHQPARKRAADRVSGPISRERPGNRHGARPVRGGGRHHAPRPRHHQRAVRLGRTRRALGALRDRPGEGPSAEPSPRRISRTICRCRSAD